MGVGRQEGRLREFGGYIQDQWRVKQNLTVNAGVRYDIQNPFSAKNSSYTYGDIANICGVSGAASDNSCNLFKFGATTPMTPQFQQLKAGSPSYNVDYDNIAPTHRCVVDAAGASGLPWHVDGRRGLRRPRRLRALLQPRGLNDFTGFYNANPGIASCQLSGTKATTTSARCRSCSARRRGSAPAASRPHPTYPMTDLHDAGHQRVRPEHPGALRRLVAGRHHAVARQEHGARGPLCRHARPATAG